jgi:hypothetical protein
MPFRECTLSAIDIPSLATAVSGMENEISKTSSFLPKVQQASIYLEQTIHNSHYVDLSAYEEATALKQSVHNLELAISEIKERMKSLKVILSKKVRISTTLSLSTADDVSAAFHIAVNGSEIDWPFAEAVLREFAFIRNKDVMDNRGRGREVKVWRNNDFECNIIKLLRGGDCWRVRKSLQLIRSIFCDAFSSEVMVTTDFF